jgi:hypothetical protein
LSSFVPLSLLPRPLLSLSFFSSFSCKSFHTRLMGLLSRYSFIFLNLSPRELVLELL